VPSGKRPWISDMNSSQPTPKSLAAVRKLNA
jgi:hypothetical protein